MNSKYARPDMNTFDSRCGFRRVFGKNVARLRDQQGAGNFLNTLQLRPSADRGSCCSVSK